MAEGAEERFQMASLRKRYGQRDLVIDVGQAIRESSDIDRLGGRGVGGLSPRVKRAKRRWNVLVMSLLETLRSSRAGDRIRDVP